MNLARNELLNQPLLIEWAYILDQFFAWSFLWNFIQETAKFIPHELIFINKQRKHKISRIFLGKNIFQN